MCYNVINGYPLKLQLYDVKMLNTKQDQDPLTIMQDTWAYILAIWNRMLNMALLHDQCANSTIRIKKCILLFQKHLVPQSSILSSIFLLLQKKKKKETKKSSIFHSSVAHDKSKSFTKVDTWQNMRNASCIRNHEKHEHALHPKKR